MLRSYNAEGTVRYPKLRAESNKQVRSAIPDIGVVVGRDGSTFVRLAVNTFRQSCEQNSFPCHPVRLVPEYWHIKPDRGKAMELANAIQQIANNADAMKEQLQTEEATKTALIMPFIAALGYNVFDPNATLLYSA